ncbi:MAG: NAD-dependent epimerase/dehydratase family protein [Saprospiraceae bacterium]
MSTTESNQKILVTGGTGFIGAYLLHYLLQQGYSDIRAIKRPGSPMDLVSSIADRIEWVEADVCDVADLALAMKGVKKVYHSAAVVSFNDADARRMQQVNVEGTANVVNLALDEGVEKLLHVSSIAALGSPKDSDTISEATKWEPGHRGTNYGLTKHLAEMEVWRGRAEGLPVAVVNPANVLGSGFWRGRTSTGKLFHTIWQGLKFYPPGSTGWVDVRDVVRFMVKLMESDIEGERYILSAENRTFKWVFDRIAAALDVPPPSIRANAFLREMAWRAAWLQSKLTGTPPLITKETARSSATTKLYDNSKSLSAFDGFQYTPIESTIDEMAEQFLKAAEKGFEPMLLSFQ